LQARPGLGTLLMIRAIETCYAPEAI
jgi:hypothetical protein